MIQESHGWMTPVLGLTKYFFGDVVLTWFGEGKHTKEEVTLEKKHHNNKLIIFEVGGLMQKYLESNIVLSFIGNFKITIALLLKFNWKQYQ